jgi:hypothetical protein
MAALLHNALAGKTDGVNFSRTIEVIPTGAGKDKLGGRMAVVKPPDRMHKIPCALC